MKFKDIKLGMRMKIVGSEGGCAGKTRCKNCSHFKKGIIITKLIDTPVFGGRRVGGQSINNKNDKCTFNPNDLQLIDITNWEKEFES